MQSKHVDKRKALTHSLAYLSALSLFQFLVYYAPMLSDLNDSVIYHLTALIFDICNITFPLAIALVIYLFCNSKKSRVLAALLLSFSRIVFNLPYYYLSFVTDYYDSLESIILSAIVSIVCAIGLFAQIFVILFVILLFDKRFSGAETAANNAESKNRCAMIFDFNDYLNFAIAIAVLIFLAVALVTETIEIVKFFIDYGANATYDELISIVISLLLHIVASFISYLFLASAKNRMLKNKN